MRCPRAERNPIAWAAVELPTALPRPAHLMDCSAGRVRSRHGDPRLGCSLFLPSAPSLCWLEEIPHGCSGGSRRYLLLPEGVCYLAEQRNAVEARSFLSGAALMPSCAQPSLCTRRG